MKTEYPYGLGRDRRELSYYQSKDWMDKIKCIKKKFPDRKGEKSTHSRLNNALVFWIRSCTASSREIICAATQISERHWYDIRAKRRWKHI